MKLRAIASGLLVVSLIGFAAGYYLLQSYDLGLCLADAATRTYDVICHEFFNKIGTPLFYGMPALAIVFLALAIFPDAFMTWWKKFAIWTLPILVLIFVGYQQGSWDPAPQTVFKFFAAVYVIISLLIIGWGALRKKNP